MLTCVFALEGRVRPFNKWLAHDLQRAPLPIDNFLARVSAISDAPDLVGQQALFRDIEQLARARGVGPLVDDWQPDVPFLRGDASH